MDAGKRLSAEHLKYTQNGSKADKKQMKEACSDDSDDVDIIGCSNSGGNELDEVQHQDSTESSSSSFGNSDSDDDNLGDEATSSLHGDAESTGYYYRVILRPRKRKLTTHWTTFIRPVMWRCKWVELQIKELEAQAKKYERQLAKYNQQEHDPFSQSNNLLRRKKRRKPEATTNLAAHMSNHNLFSYYAERRKGINQAVGKAKRPAVAGQKNKVVETFELDGDDYYPTEAEQMLQKIMSLKSRVGEMRGRFGKVIAENCEENFCPLMLNDFALDESRQYNTTPFPNIGGGTHVGSYSSQYMAEKYATDAFMTGIASTSYASQYMTEPYVYDAFMTGIASTSHAHEVPDSTQTGNLAYFADALEHVTDHNSPNKEIEENPPILHVYRRRKKN